MDITDKEFKELSKYIKRHSGISIADTKKYLILQRLTPFVKSANCASFSEYIKKLNECSLHGESNKVINAMTTNETSFFRDKKLFEILKDDLLEDIIKSARCANKKKIIIWSTATSTGQEAYSIAIIIYEYCKNNFIYNYKFEDFEIIATDISECVINKAVKGIYSNIEILRGLDEELIESYFTRNQLGDWEIKSFLKSIIKFKTINLLHNFSNIPKCDIIFCRNVLIYFENEIQGLILSKIYKLLDKNGLLFLGSMENAYLELKKYEKFTHETYTVYIKGDKYGKY